jgi:hypothetical protein
VNFVANVAESIEMEVLLVLVHTLGSHKVAVEVFPDELVDQNPSYFVVEPLFGQIVDIQIFWMNLDKESQSFFIDVAVEKSLDHVLIEVEPLQGVGVRTAPLFHQFLDDSLRLPFLLDERNYQSDDVWDDVSVLNLLHAALLFDVCAFWVIVFIFFQNHILSYLLGFLH